MNVDVIDKNSPFFIMGLIVAKEIDPVIIKIVPNLKKRRNINDMNGYPKVIQSLHCAVFVEVFVLFVSDGCQVIVRHHFVTPP